MDRNSLNKLRLDRRLIRRAKWIAREDLERELAALPDASSKVAPPEEVTETSDERTGA